jgi:hypothetical protein
MESIMVDPTGTAGVIKENSLDLAVKGGPKFMERLEQLADASDRHEQTLAQLEIGQSAVAAFNQAQCKLAEAEHSRKLVRPSVTKPPRRWPMPKLTPRPKPSSLISLSRTQTYGCGRPRSTWNMLRGVSGLPQRRLAKPNALSQMQPDFETTYRARQTAYSPLCVKSPRGNK